MVSRRRKKGLKKPSEIILLFLLIIMIIPSSFTACGHARSESEVKEAEMDDEIIQGSSAESLMETLESKYSIPISDGIKSPKGSFWIYMSRNDDYSYEITADEENGQIIAAKIYTYNGDVDFIIECAGMIKGSYFKTETVKGWVADNREMLTQKEDYISKDFGDVTCEIGYDSIDKRAPYIEIEGVHYKTWLNGF